MKQIALIGAGIVAVLVGLGAIMPALAQVRDQGTLLQTHVWSYTLGVFLVTASLTCGVCSFVQKFLRT